MHVALVVIGILGFLLFIAIITVVLVLVIREEPPVAVVPISQEGVDIGNLPEISGLPCCVANGRVLDQVYVPMYNFVVSATPTPFGTACNGFTNDTERDTCLALARPSEPGEVASPVARKGTKLYYVLAGGLSACPSTTACAVT